jgi:hypothetical protein
MARDDDICFFVGHDFRSCGKTPDCAVFLKGHGFSRAANPPNNPGLQPPREVLKSPQKTSRGG